MFHLKPKPSPPRLVGRETPGKAVEFLGDGDRAGKPSVNQLVGAPEEGDRLAVLLAAVGVREPLALAARIVEVEHRGDRVDPQAVDVEAVDPVERVAIEEVGDLEAAEIVDRGIPVRMEALSRVGVLVERGAVEPREPVLVGREMRRNPVDDHAEARGVRPVDEAGEARRLAEAARRARTGQSADSPRTRRAGAR